jgi:hypothetical protein
VCTQAARQRSRVVEIWWKVVQSDAGVRGEAKSSGRSSIAPMWDIAVLAARFTGKKSRLSRSEGRHPALFFRTGSTAGPAIGAASAIAAAFVGSSITAIARVAAISAAPAVGVISAAPAVVAAIMRRVTRRAIATTTRLSVNGAR